MSGAPRRLFSYPDNPGWIFLAVTVVCGGVALFLFALFLLEGFVAGLSPSHSAYLVVAVVALFVAWLSQAGFFWKPIAVSDDGVEAMLGGRVWRRIAWADMDRIEKRIVPVESDGEGGFNRSYEVVQFRSGRRTIAVRSTILGYEELKRCVTEQAKRHAIEMALVEPQPLWRAPHITRLDEL